MKQYLAYGADKGQYLALELRRGPDSMQRDTLAHMLHS